MNETRATSYDDLADFYRWFSAIRTFGVLIAALGIAAFHFLGWLAFDPRPVLFVIMPALLLSSLLWLTLLDQRVLVRPLLYVQLIVDTLLVTAGTYFSGGVQSDFLFLYAVVVVSATLISLRAVCVATAASVLAFLFLLYGANLGLLPARAGVSGVPGPADFQRLALFVFVAAILGFQSYYYVSRFKRKDEEILKLKDEFLFRAVHDLRAPLTALKWITERLKKPGFLASHPDMREDVRQMQDLSARMLKLIEDLLAVSRGEQADVRLALEPVNTTGLLRQLIGQYAGAAEAANVLISLKPYAAVLNANADADALKEIFSNLIENAVKYNRPGGSVIVSNRAGAGGAVVVEIEDTGIGIAPENLPRLFSPYFRTAEAKRLLPGTGLGLYLVKKLSERMGGRVSVASTPGAGTTFTVELPGSG